MQLLDPIPSIKTCSGSFLRGNLEDAAMAGSGLEPSILCGAHQPRSQGYRGNTQSEHVHTNRLVRHLGMRCRHLLTLKMKQTALEQAFGVG